MNKAVRFPESRRERNKRDKRNRIVGAARALFNAQGYEKTTTQQIAAAADIAEGTLFLYAPTKGDLLVLVFAEELAELVERTYAAMAKDAPLVEQVLELFGGMIRYHAKDVETARALIRELTFLGNPQRRESVDIILETNMGHLQSIVQSRIDAGEIRPVDTQLLSRVLFSLYLQQLQGWLSQIATKEEFEGYLRKVFTFTIDPYLTKKKSD